MSTGLGILLRVNTATEDFLGGVGCSFLGAEAKVRSPDPMGRGKSTIIASPFSNVRTLVEASS